MDPNKFIDNLKRDKARGVIAPHQIVLISALYNIYQREKKSKLNIDEIDMEFQKVWNKNCDKFLSRSNLLGMPLKAFYNQGFIDVKFNEPVDDFRRLKSLKTNIENVEIGNSLINLFSIKNLDLILNQRFNN